MKTRWMIPFKFQTAPRNGLAEENDNPPPGTYFGPMHDEWIRIIIQGHKRDEINAKRILNVPRFPDTVLIEDQHEVGLYSAYLINISRHPHLHEYFRFQSRPPPGTYFVNPKEPEGEDPRKPPFRCTEEVGSLRSSV